MDFVTLDFETANSSPESPCEIGLTFVEDGKVRGTYAKLIRPPGNRYDYWNTKVHGIKPHETAYQPAFDEIWKEVAPLVADKFMIAHNASFDFSVLRKTLRFYGQDVPSLLYACSVQLSKKVWQGLPKYNLKALCDHHGIPLNHHRAEADSLATAQLCIRAFQDGGIESVEDIRAKLGTHIWQMQAEANVRLAIKKNKVNSRVPRLELVSKRSPGSIFYNKKIVLAGKFLTLTKSEVVQEIIDLGGFPEERITNETNFLIQGKEDERKIMRYPTKQRIAMDFIARGAEITFLTEEDFLNELDRIAIF